MSLIRHVVGGLRALVFKRDVDRELDDEVRQYIEAATQEHIRSGLSREQAERVARVDFGGIENAKDIVRAGGWEFSVESWIRDLQYSLRSLRAAPGYAIAAVGILGDALVNAAAIGSGGGDFQGLAAVGIDGDLAIPVHRKCCKG